ncbi:MAG: XamI family restriction endonuclease [Cyanobacteriota bacterium]|nr:XamI family restriction endonuclease [Cyanobacteriota bacterium]
MLQNATLYLGANGIRPHYLCGNVAVPIIRNAQEQRQLSSIKNWLEKKGYSYVETGSGLQLN